MTWQSQTNFNMHILLRNSHIKTLIFMCTFPSYLLGVLCSWSLLNVLFKSTPTDLLVSWEWGGGWLVGANPGFPKERETAVSVALATALLGGKVFGRRSGRPDCKTGWDGREKLLILGCERRNSHAGTCCKAESLRVSVNKMCFQHSSWNLKSYFQFLPLSPSVSSLASELTWCWSKGCWLLLLVWVNREGPEPAVFLTGPCATARRFLDGEVFTGYMRKSVN